MSSKIHQHKIFVSYAHVDNAAGRDADGWVSKLILELRRRVIGEVGSETGVDFCIDMQLNGHETLPDQIRRSIADSSIFLIIGSKAYLESDWCMNKELPQFLTQMCGDRIFVVEKMPYDRQRLPAPVKDHIGKIFWEVNKLSKKHWTFGDIPGPESEEAFQRAVNDLSQEIGQLIASVRVAAVIGAEALPPGAAVAPPVGEGGAPAEPAAAVEIARLVVEPPGEGAPAVYLAEGSEQLEEEMRPQVRAYLQQAGIHVFTSRGFPADPSGYRAQLKEILRRPGIVFVQLLDAARGRTLNDEETRVGALQLDVARKQCVPILQWRSENLDVNAVTDAAQREMLCGPEVRSESLEEFKKAVADRARRPSARALITTTAADRDIAEELACIVRGMKISCDIADMAVPADSIALHLRECEVLIFLQGTVNQGELLRHVQSCTPTLLGRQRSGPQLAILQGPPPPKMPIPFKYFKPKFINFMESIDPGRVQLFFEFLPTPED